MTNGYGAMPDYAAQLTPADRWAVAANIRALQLSQNAKESDVPQGTQIENLGDVAQQQGLPASLAGPWELPGTAVSAKPQQGNVAGVEEEIQTSPASKKLPPENPPATGPMTPKTNRGSGVATRPPSN